MRHCEVVMKEPIKEFHYRYCFETSEALTTIQFNELQNYILYDLCDSDIEEDIPWIVSDFEQTKIKESEK